MTFNSENVSRLAPPVVGFSLAMCSSRRCARWTEAASASTALSTQRRDELVFNARAPAARILIIGTLPRDAP